MTRSKRNLFIVILAVIFSGALYLSQVTAGMADKLEPILGDSAHSRVVLTITGAILALILVILIYYSYREKFHEPCYEEIAVENIGKFFKKHYPEHEESVTGPAEKAGQNNSEEPAKTLDISETTEVD